SGHKFRCRRSYRYARCKIIEYPHIAFDTAAQQTQKRVETIFPPRRPAQALTTQSSHAREV
ncbi:hypothetical protein TSAR_014646, partial [Trichomalopsis sarcophagae]